MVIGYLTSLYARAADTFIRNEVAELRRRGHVVRTFSIRGPVRDEALSEAIRCEQEGTDYILAKGAPALIARFAAELVRGPHAVLAAARLAWRMRPPGLRALVWQLAYLVEAAYLAGRIREERIEHLHDHIGTNSASVAMLAASIAGIPFSMTVHGPVEFEAPERFALGAKIERAAFTVCVSSFGRAQCMRWSRPDAWARIHVVRCGLGPEFLSAECTPVPGEPRFASIGRLDAQKGQLVLVDAVAQLVAGGVPCRVDLIGDGPLRPLLEESVRSRGIGDAVRLLGWRDGAQVREALLAARALVLSSFAEGLPIVLMEALAFGRPVIATAVAGIPELVEHHVNGWLVPAGSAEALAAALREAIEASDERMAQMGADGAKRVRALHDLREQGARLEHLMLGARSA